MKKEQSNLIMLNIIFVVSIVIANVVGCKVIDTGLSIGNIRLCLSGGAITYAFTFLCTDIIGELWGKKEAGLAVKRGFYAQLFALALIILTRYTPTSDTAMQDAYVRLLGQTPFFVAGSLCAYLCSQKWDVWIFHHIRSKYVKSGEQTNGRRWIWNNASTATSQIIDTVIYAIVAFGIGMGFLFKQGGINAIIGIIFGQYLLKLCLAILDTPIFYILTKPENNVLRTKENGDSGKPQADA